MTYGFEREYFLQRDSDNQFVLVPNDIPKDDCGYLVEVRGKEASDPIEAAMLWEAEAFKVTEKLSKLGLHLNLESTQKLPKSFLRTALRQFGRKDVATDRSLSGKWNNINYQHAGLHVHFGNSNVWKSTSANCKASHSYTEMFDMGKYIFALDKAFEESIRLSKRALGLYEMKYYGFEYRSLPNTVSPLDVATVIRSL